jgi:hypothetical protein
MKICLKVSDYRRVRSDDTTVWNVVVTAFNAVDGTNVERDVPCLSSG